MLYYSINGASDARISDLIFLKLGITLSTRQCEECITFLLKEEFIGKGRTWDRNGVAQDIAKRVNLEDFIRISNIDGRCEQEFQRVSCHLGRYPFLFR